MLATSQGPMSLFALSVDSIEELNACIQGFKKAFVNTEEWTPYENYAAKGGFVENGQ
jgi:hypothetical protein